MDLCDVCSQLSLEPNYYKDQYLGPYPELLSKSHSLGPGRDGCRGCSFFCAILHNSETSDWRTSDLPTSFVCLDWTLNLDVRDSEETGRESLDYDDDTTLDLCREEEDVGAEAVVDRVWPVPNSPADASCFDLVRTWISQCASHVSCRDTTSATLPRRVIAIAEDPTLPPRLHVTNNELGQYVILSHCWGKKGLTKLKKSLISKFQEGIDLEELPKSFKDAISITRQLGFRYLWIDALCIIQDNAEDWEQEAAKMTSYYGQSMLMISATAAEDSSKGILTNREVLYSPVMGKQMRYRLRQRLLCWTHDITSSVLHTRGWAFQERMLAPRILHYTRRQMIWECANGFRFEASTMENPDISRVDEIFSIKGEFEHSIKESLGGVFRERKDPHNNRNRAPGAWNPYTCHQDGFECWHECVKSYTERRLTMVSDRLHAISGIAAIVNHDGKMGEYLAGLWSNHMEAGLCWAISKWRSQDSPQVPTYTAPSWSWASHNYPVSVTANEHPSTIPEDITKEITEKFNVRLVEHHMVLQDPRNVYGAVLQGSYIAVDTMCLTRKELLRLAKHRNEKIYYYPHGVMDQESYILCPCFSHPGSIENLMPPNQDDMDARILEIDEWHDHMRWDFCMFLEISTSAMYMHGCEVEVLLLEWVDKEARIARRVGHLTLVFGDILERERLDVILHQTPWKRWRLKLV